MNLSWQEAVRRLERLLDGRLLANQSSVLDNDEAHGFYTLVSSLAQQTEAPSGTESARDALARLAGDVWQQAAQLSGSLQRSPLNSVAWQLETATVMLLGCTQMAAAVGLGHRESFKLAGAAASLLLGAGRGVAEEHRRLAAGCQLRPEKAAEDARGHLLHQVDLMLSALVLLRQPHNLAGLQAFARTSGTAQCMLPWLLAVTKLLQLVVPSAEPGSEAAARLIVSYPELLDGLLNDDAFASLHQAIQQDVSVPGELLGTLLLCLDLAMRQLESSSSMGDSSSNSGSSISGSGIGASGGSRLAAAALEKQGPPPQQLGAVIAALRCVTSPSLLPAGHMLVIGNAAEMAQLTVLAARALDFLPAGRAVLSDPELADMAGAAVKLASFVTWQLLECVGDRQPEAAWELICLFPAIADALRLLASEQIVAQLGQEQLPSLCYLTSGLLEAHIKHVTTVSTANQIEFWCQAVDAGLQLAPRLARLQLSWQQCAPFEDPQNAAHVAEVQKSAGALLERVLSSWQHMMKLSRAFYAQQANALPAGSATAAATAFSLWTLHSTACRFVHWASALDSEQQAAVPAVASWDRRLADVLRSTFWLVCEVHLHLWNHLVLAPGTLPDDAGTNREVILRRMHSMAAAQWAALPAICSKLGVALHDAQMAESLLHIAALLPSAASCPELVQAFPQSQRQSWQALGNDAEELWGAAVTATYLAQDWPSLGALLINSGVLADLLDRAAEAGLPQDQPAAGRALATACAVVLNLGEEGQQALQAVERSGAVEQQQQQQQLVAVLAEAATEISQIEPSFCSALPTEGGPASLTKLEQCWQQLLPAGARLAAALQQYWQELEQQAVTHLELSQAAAVRSCAYLRCANLGGEGGPNAGKGKGSQKCSACRAVWYCGTACSHADWRAGHRRACKALAAARQQAQQHCS